MTPFRTTRRVEFGDTDMAGIMHFANFFRFMEVAETDFLLSRGLNVSWDRAGDRVGFPRVSAACDYSAPARFGDVLTIAVTVEKIGRKSVSYRYDFTRDATPERLGLPGDRASETVAIAVGRMTAVYVRKTPAGMESAEIPPDVRAKLEE